MEIMIVKIEIVITEEKIVVLKKDLRVEIMNKDEENHHKIEVEVIEIL